MAYINGNLALQPKRKQDQQTVIKETKRLVKTRKSIPVQEKLLYMFTVLMCVVVAGVIILRYAQIYDMSIDIKKLNNEYQTMNIEMEDLKKQVEMLSDPERIRKLAESQGMVSVIEGGITVNTGDNEIKSVMNE
ncbi:cell division protein FtsL [Paenibacillus sp. FSL H8-0548]|uniref:cell division protein FtsL n=1 Tax=Paenibacillus sp. FSL H8-0548 TaxID=1920422 RepID=UPI00096D4E30|nr:cell division protein FtsL [Paenibacillus sp. FSL H8-0548]OMF21048.1 cell division protein FtsL [Paenibacillus sp. FSL H8-0548]